MTHTRRLLERNHLKTEAHQPPDDVLRGKNAGKGQRHKIRGGRYVVTENHGQGRRQYPRRNKVPSLLHSRAAAATITAAKAAKMPSNTSIRVRLPRTALPAPRMTPARTTGAPLTAQQQPGSS